MEDTRLLLIEEKKREKTTVVLYDFVCIVRVGLSIVHVYGKIMQKIRKQSRCIDYSTYFIALLRENLLRYELTFNHLFLTKNQFKIQIE